MLKVYSRSTGEEMAVNIEDIMRVEKKTYAQAEATHYQRTYVLLCNPCYGKWMDVSEEYNKVIDKYRGKAKLVKYTPTVYDLEQLKVNPDHINDMPRWYVPGLDRALSSDELEPSSSVDTMQKTRLSSLWSTSITVPTRLSKWCKYVDFSGAKALLFF